MARKMALVPAELANLQHHSPSGAILGQLSLLDQQMKSVLDDTSTTPELKLQKYYSTLRRYETLQDNSSHMSVPVRVDEGSVIKRDAPTSLPALESAILEQVPKPQRQSAKLLLEHVKENPDISWNQNRELVHKGSVVTGSNIFDLISDFSRNRRNQAPAQGWKEFTDAL